MRGPKFGSGDWNLWTTKLDSVAEISTSTASFKELCRSESISTPHWNDLCCRPRRPYHRICHCLQRRNGYRKAEKILRRRLAAYPLPILRLARLAVDERFQGHGIGRLLLRAMLALALEMRDRVGSIGVSVDANPDAITFYSSLGFNPIDLVSGALGDRPEPIAMFLSFGQIAVAAKEATDLKSNA